LENFLRKTCDAVIFQYTAQDCHLFQLKCGCEQVLQTNSSQCFHSYINTNRYKEQSAERDERWRPLHSYKRSTHPIRTESS